MLVRRHIFVGCLGLVLASLAIAGYVYANRTDELPPPAQSSNEKQILYWRDHIRREGGDQSYEQFATYAQNFDINTQHALVHNFGSALWWEAGVDGLSVCDSRFSFGCFHQFLGEAIQELGIESIPKLNTGCFNALASKSPLSCQHGIGHGALSTFGYDEAALLRALETCRNLPGSDPIGGCYGGVFMEYNVRTMLMDQSMPREFTGNPFAPCDALAAEFVPACIYWQPQWWRQTAANEENPAERFKKMGAYCTEFADTAALQRTCFEGLGNIVASESNFDPAKVRDLCDTSSAKPLQRLFCRSIGANHLSVDVDTASALAVCEDLQGDALPFCEAYARNEANVLLIREVPVL